MGGRNAYIARRFDVVFEEQIRQLDLLATLVLPTALVRSPHLTRHGGSEELGV
jgi:hypothetical protein